MKQTRRLLAVLVLIAIMVVGGIPIHAEVIANEQQPAEILTEFAEEHADPPTPEPTEKPAETPAPEPTGKPTEAPTPEPTAEPTEIPIPDPTAEPEGEPTEAPVPGPAAEPEVKSTTENTDGTHAEKPIPFQAKIEIRLEKKELYYGDDLKAEAVVTEANMSYELKWEKMDPLLPEKDRKWETFSRENPLKLKITEAAAALNYRCTLTGANGEEISKTFAIGTPSYRKTEEDEASEEREPEEPAEDAEEAEPEEPAGTAEEAETQESAEDAEEAEPEEPAGAAEEAETEESAEDAEEVEPEEPAGAAEEAETEESAEDAEEAEPEEPAGAAEEAEAEEPTEDAEEAEPEEPAGTAEEAETEEPAEDAEEAEPEEPAGTAEEAESEDPAEDAEEVDAEENPEETLIEEETPAEEAVFLFSALYTETDFGNCVITSPEGNLFRPDLRCNAVPAAMGKEKVEELLGERLDREDPGPYRMLNTFALSFNSEEEKWETTSLIVEIEIKEPAVVGQDEKVLLLREDQGELQIVDSLNVTIEDSLLKNVRFGTSGLSAYAILIVPESPSENPAENTKLLEKSEVQSIKVFTSFTGVIQYGELVSLTSEVEGDVLDYQWECDKGQGFEKVEGANEATYCFTATPESLCWDWRLTVIRP